MRSAVTIRGPVSLRFVNSVADEIQNVYDEITQCAYELFLSGGGGAAISIEDWLKAERQLLVKPPARIAMMGKQLQVIFDLAGAPETGLEIVTAPEMLLIQSTGDSVPKVFRTLNLPAAIEFGSVDVQVEDRLLVFKALTRSDSSIKAAL
jgi:hypothetical protein